jgi:hypothetical protein
LREGPSNKALKLTRSHGGIRMEALRATMRRLSGPLQLNAMFGRRVSMDRVRSAVMAGVVLASAGFAAPDDVYVPPDVAALPACRASDVPRVPEDWSAVGDEQFAWSRPPACKRDTDARFMHGGERWLCGTSSVSVSWGHWALASFEGSQPRCSGVLHGVRIVVVDDAPPSPGVSVWYLLPTDGGHQPVIGVHHGQALQPGLSPVAFSGRLLKAKPKG